MAIKEIFLKDYKQPDFKCQKIDLIFDIFDEYTLVTNTMQIEKSTNENDLTLDSIDLELIELWLNDLKLNDTRYVYGDEKLKILNVPNSFSIKIINKNYFPASFLLGYF